MHLDILIYHSKYTLKRDEGIIGFKEPDRRSGQIVVENILFGSPAESILSASSVRLRGVVQ